MKREQQIDTLEEMCELMCVGGAIFDSHKKSKMEFYKFIWECFGVSPTEYKASNDKFKHTMMVEYEEYLDGDEFYYD